MPLCLCTAPSSLPSPVSCDSLTPCSWWLCCLKELTQGEGTACLSTGRDEEPWILSLPPVPEKRDHARQKCSGFRQEIRDTGTSQGDGCLGKRRDQAKLCKVLQNGTQDLQRKSHGGISTWQYCSGLGMLLYHTPWSWCIIHCSWVMTFKLVCSSKF